MTKSKIVIKATKIGPNERTGMKTYFLVNVVSRNYADEGLSYMVTINRVENGMYVRDMVAIENHYFGYKKKSEALKLYKKVVDTIKRTGSEEAFEQRGTTSIKQ